MLSYANSFIVYMLEMLIAFCVFSGIGEKKFHTVIIFAIGCAIFISGAVVNVIFANSAWINLVYTLIMNLAFALCCFRIEIKTALFYSLLLDFFSAVFEIITILLVSTILGIHVAAYNTDIAILVLEVSISKAFYFLSCVTLLRFTSKSSFREIKTPLSFYIFPFCTLLCSVFFRQICGLESMSNKSKLQLAYLSIALLISTIVLFITYRHNLEKENEYLRTKSELENLETKKDYYEILEHQNQQLMIYAHDAKNHLAAIHNLSGNPDIHEYVQNLSNQLKTYTSFSHSGNRILDVMISRYNTECEMRGISLDYDVKSCNLSSMDDIDVVAVLGNLMDNALSAAEQSEEKHISLETTWRNSYSVLIISNSCDIEPVSRGGALITTRKESRLHGFGLRSVKKTLKKYQGDFAWEYDRDKHLFIVTAMIGDKV